MKSDCPLFFVFNSIQFRYCDCHYRFPPQEEVIKSAVELVLDSLEENPRTLIAVGTYLVGKERVFQGE